MFQLVFCSFPHLSAAQAANYCALAPEWNDKSSLLVVRRIGNWWLCVKFKSPVWCCGWKFFVKLLWGKSSEQWYLFCWLTKAFTLYFLQIEASSYQRAKRESLAPLQGLEQQFLLSGMRRYIPWVTLNQKINQTWCTVFQRSMTELS